MLVVLNMLKLNLQFCTKNHLSEVCGMNLNPGYMYAK